ncbi:MAG: hypothetical protein H6719_01855 [Sandaracinaceae bacterium]|nr:hypothetical protein [Sandaracinaceae bacterium]
MTISWSATGAAQAGIRVHSVESVRIDGSLGDWRDATFTEVGSGDDASMRFAVAADDRGLYVGAEVRDDRLVRTGNPGAREDAVILTLSIGEGRRTQLSDIYLFAGVSGRSAARVGIASRIGGPPREMAGARIVEGPRRAGHGYVVEAFLPFARIPGGARWDTARGTIRLRDVDSEAHPEVEAEPALVPTSALVPLLPSGGASGALETFLASQGMSAARPTFDLSGDVAEDPRPERVFVVGRFVLVTGPGYRGGQSYSFHELPIDQPTDARSAVLRDLTGDGKAELLLVIRQRNAQGERDLWQVLSLSGDRPTPVFGIETRKATRAGSIESTVRVLRARGSAPEIEVVAGRAQGLDRESYQEAPADDVQAILLPWGPIRSRRYRWNGRAFAQTSERPNPDYREPEPARPNPTTSARPEPTAPTRPSEEELLAAFRRDRNIRRGVQPTHRFRTNLAGDREPETALVYGRQLVVVGPGIQDGASWLFYEIPAASDDDLVRVEAADVTGDGRGELLFTVRQRFGEVSREVLVVHQIAGRGFPRLLQVEVARSNGSAFVRNEVRTRGGRLEITPGNAREWGAERWPFTQDPNDSAEALLLPWRDRPIRYRLQGARLVH